jgi:hypothetical protein
VFKNEVLRIFGPKRDEVTEEWRKLYNEEFQNSYSSPCIIRMIKSRTLTCAEHVASEERGKAYKILVGKAQGKRPLSSTKCRWEENIKTDLGGIGSEDADWIELAQSTDQ